MTLVRFHPIERDDLSLLQGWRNDPDVRLICREYRLLTILHQEDWYERVTRDTDFLMSKIEAVDSGAFIGVCGWTFIDWRSRHALLSMYIGDKDYRTDRYYAAILHGLHSVAFNELGMNCVRAEIYDFDPRKEHFYRAGYKENGRRRQQYYHNGEFWDIIITDLLRGEWIKLCQSTQKAES